MRRNALELGLVFLTAVGLYALRTWPLCVELGSAVPAHPRLDVGDQATAWTDASSLAHAMDVLAGRATAFEAEGLSEASQRERCWSEHGFLPSLMALPLAWLGPPLAAVNLLRFALFGLAACASWVLARRVGLGRLGSALVAATWCVSAPQAHHSLGPISQLPSPWLPLCALFLLRWMDTSPWTAPRTLAPALALGCCAGMSLLATPSALGALLLLGGALVLLAPSIDGERAASRRLGLLVPVGWAALGGALLLSAWPWFAAALAAGPPPAGSAWLSPGVELPALLRPPELHALFAREPQAGAQQPSPPAMQYLGAALLSLSLWGALLEPRARRWALAGGLLVVLALDPTGSLASWKQSQPWARVLGAPERTALVVALLPLGVAAAWGVQALAVSRAGRAGVWMALALFAFEVQVRWPQALSRTEVPSLVNRLAELDGQGAVQVLPLPRAPHPTQAWEPLHGARVPLPHVSLSDPTQLELLAVGYPELARSLMPAWRPEPEGLAIDLRQAGVDHVFVRERDLAHPQAVLAQLDQMPGWTRGASEGGVHWWFRNALLWEHPWLLDDAN